MDSIFILVFSFWKISNWFGVLSRFIVRISSNSKYFFVLIIVFNPLLIQIIEIMFFREQTNFLEHFLIIYVRIAFIESLHLSF